MQLDDLKKTWKEELEMKSAGGRFNVIHSDLVKYDRKATFSWALEVFVCMAVIIAVSFGWYTTENPSFIFQVGMTSMIIAMIFVGGKIIYNRRVNIVDDWTLAAKLNIQIEKRKKDIKLLRGVAYWYLSPIFFAVILSSYGGYAQRTGSYIPDAGLWIYWAIVVVLYVGIYFYNQYLVKAKVQPALDQLYRLKQALES